MFPLHGGRHVLTPVWRCTFGDCLFRSLIGSLLTALATCVPVFGDEALRDWQVESLEVLPPALQIGGANPNQQILVTALGTDGHRYDVTHEATLHTGDEALAVVKTAVVRGVRDGQTDLTVRFGSASAKIPVVVASAEAHPPVHFVNDIVPLFAKLRCNGSGCHGKQSGQNGFKLSVFGFDPGADFRALVMEGRGRRIFPAAPERSLLVLKATGLMPHGGGRRRAAHRTGIV